MNLPDGVDVGKAVNEAMELVEAQSTQLKDVSPKTYIFLQNNLLRELICIFNNSVLNKIKDDVIGRIYEYFLNKFAPAVALDDGVFFTSKSFVHMIVNIIEQGTMLDIGCLRTLAYQADLATIEVQFMASVKEVKKEIGHDFTVQQTLTKEAAERMFEELTKGQDVENPQATLEQITAAILSSVAGMGGVDQGSLEQTRSGLDRLYADHL